MEILGNKEVIAYDHWMLSYKVIKSIEDMKKGIEKVTTNQLNVQIGCYWKNDMEAANQKKVSYREYEPSYRKNEANATSNATGNMKVKAIGNMKVEAIRNMKIKLVKDIEIMNVQVIKGM